MAQYIDKSTLVAEIESKKKIAQALGDNAINNSVWQFYEGMKQGCVNILSSINTLEVKEIENPVIPKHSYFEQIYHCGSEPRWKIGDILAVYEFYSDYEGEYIYGEITDIKMDEENEDWVYTFKDGDIAYENMLISEETYKKN